ncbi:2-succinyl-5-enolpyruvyl-6-hydroxy-3-cyclohexene-1-carboxylic-acid synthase [uncultured Maribacter sp.]|uniref:2-succinyl-5-enolpyruvyl-6-hydroxy-3- cyclohexene-1-carboxylic-acid synthase n=1 Tax=uncultured Maribacter sp. TaxID=431308 RepID=UPI0026333DD9|nr:2-succinyl-5-enolpyruvyl-6-hydroxy-3-cyclohexene-1-carboxylic-acid synthase [uncultured Maribacter sp.]
MMYSNIPSAQTIIQHCQAKGVKNIILSPGSRNAPLTISFTENPFFTCFSIVDERCAAFFALGMAQQLKEPVAIVCTSGSALLNYYPAIAEAFYSDIPLVVISADRPSYKIDIGDGQTIRQPNVFANHIGYSANLKQDIFDDPVEQKDIQSFNDEELNKAFRIAKDENSPIHINVPFEEPLYEKTKDLSVVANVFKAIGREAASNFVIEDFNEIWSKAERIMVLVGVNAPNSIDQSVLEMLGEDPRVMVLTETTSNLHHPNFFPSIDSILVPIEKSENKKELFKKLQPDVLLTFGGLVVSKKIKAFLRSYKPSNHWHIDSKKAFDTYFSLTKHIKENPNTFLIELINCTNNSIGSYFDFWKKRREQYIKKREEYSNGVVFSDFLVFRKILKSIPDNYLLQLSNSSTIRYTQLFSNNASVPVFCNRGTSGIDGSTSTAIGASIYNESPTLLITGDLSFFYDSNGLWNSYIKKNFRIIVINNDGGGIFRILPGKEESENFNTFFETTHNLTANNLCNMHGLEYLCADNEVELETNLKNFYKMSEKPKLLEVKTPRLLNDKILLGYFDFIS